MAAVGAEVTGSCFLSSGVVSFFIILLLLSIFLTAFCMDCGRRSFELHDTVDRNPSTLIRVVKLEEAMVARENPMINEIQNDEKDENTNGSMAVINRASASETAGEEDSVPFTPWRSHLGARQSHDMNTSNNSDSKHIYDTIGEGHSIQTDVSSPSTNHKPGDERSAISTASVDLSQRDLMYAQVSKKTRATTSAVHTPEEVEVEEDKFSPPLPDRNAQLD